MAGDKEGGRDDISFEYTPTWVVAVVCSVIVCISLVVERILHYTGKNWKKKNKKPLYEALLKVKEELMLLGFISLFLTVFQDRIAKFCVSPNVTKNFLPCKRQDNPKEEASSSYYQLNAFLSGARRHLLAAGESNYCRDKGEVPFLSLEALHQLHIFIFVLAVVHVIFCVQTRLFGEAMIRRWKHWEDSIAMDKYDTTKVMNRITHVHQHAFIEAHFRGIGKSSAVLRWLQSFLKQFHPSVTKSDYITLRYGFIMTHCRGNPQFDFHKYMIRALDADFKKVVGISWYLWVFVVIFLLQNIEGWNTYFWISFIPFFLLLLVGTKLEHVISQLAQEVAEKHVAIEGDLVVQLSDGHFWFHRPRIILYLIHFILFQNAFEMAFFFWILVQFGFDSCMMGKKIYIISRLIICVMIQVLCSYSTLPLYALVTQMGSSLKAAIFEEHVQAGLISWAQKAKNRGLRESITESAHTLPREGSTIGIQLGRMPQNQSAIAEGDVERAEVAPVLDGPQSTSP